MRLAIRCSGMVTAVGFNSPASCAAIRAGIRNVNETNLWDAESGTYVAAGRVHLPHWWVGLGKLAELAMPAIYECMLAARPIPPTEIPVLLGVSSPEQPFRFAGLQDHILGEIEYRLGFRLHRGSRVIGRDHVSILVALNDARKLIGDGEVPCCIVAAVDSLVHQDLVRHYLQKRRVLTPKNSNGFSPGEAGGALLVFPATSSPTGEIQVLGTGLAREKATIESEEPTRGDGLARAIGDALSEAKLTIEQVHYRISDLNGEHYKFKEMVFAVMRYSRKARPKQFDLFDLWHPIEYIGNCGAAIGPVILGVALHARQKGYAVGPKVLCTFGNDDGERAAIILGFDADEPR
jgi:3-oxoacyl-[acyl-carrier-protein] synthase I